MNLSFRIPEAITIFFPLSMFYRNTSGPLWFGTKLSKACKYAPILEFSKDTSADRAHYGMKASLRSNTKQSKEQSHQVDMLKQTIHVMVQSQASLI